MTGLRNLFLVLLTGCVWACNEYTPVTTFTEPADSIQLSEEAQLAWEQCTPEMHAGWGSIHQSYSRSEVPQGTHTDHQVLTAWKGEKVSAQILVWNPDSMDGVRCCVEEFTSTIPNLPASIAQTRFVRYTLADSREVHSVQLAPDMLDSLNRFDMVAQTVRPIWLTIQVPQDAEAGIYHSRVNISCHGKDFVSLPFELQVLDHTLPAPADWQFHLDLWQHPAAVARVQGLELWSDAHFEALKATMTLLAQAGQKVITATLNKDPWNHQCYDAYDDMIRWTYGKDGNWHYDYQVFDRWVELMMSLGINKMINCYSMVPWNNELHYMDEAKGELVTVKAEPGKADFARLWRPFLLDFRKHLADKGWLDITNIAMDERAPKEMDAAVQLLQQWAPEMGFAIADNHKSYRKYNLMRDVCVAQEQRADHEDIVKRREQGFNTTFYVCCGPAFPNTFTCSQPYEAELLGWYAAAADYDGMLRWAYNSWPENPVMDSRYGNWTSGDTYLVYPDNRSSIRFERLIDGIEIYEKIRLLRQEGANMEEVEKVLDMLNRSDLNDASRPWTTWIDRANTVLNKL